MYSSRLPNISPLLGPVLGFCSPPSAAVFAFIAVPSLRTSHSGNGLRVNELTGHGCSHILIRRTSLPLLSFAQLVFWTESGCTCHFDISCIFALSLSDGLQGLFSHHPNINSAFRMIRELRAALLHYKGILTQDFYQEKSLLRTKSLEAAYLLVNGNLLSPHSLPGSPFQRYHNLAVPGTKASKGKLTWEDYVKDILISFLIIKVIRVKKLLNWVILKNEIRTIIFHIL